MFAERLRGLGAALCDLVLPPTCAGCGRAGAPLCDRCTPGGPPLTITGLRDLRLCVTAGGWYDGELRAAVIAYKERDRRDLTAPLTALLDGGLDRAPGAIVPVPSARASVRRRGGDHVLRLARAAARARAGTAYPVLALCRPVADSAGLGVAARRANLDHAMVAGPPPRPGAPAVLVDDIVTSGATIAEAARALRAAGWQVSGAAVVAATPRRRTADPLAAPHRSV